MVEFVQFLDVQAAQLFPLADVFVTFLWQQRSASVFAEKEPAGRNQIGRDYWSLFQRCSEEDEDLLSVVHDGFEVIGKVQKVTGFDVKVLLFTFKHKRQKRVFKPDQKWNLFHVMNRVRFTR